VRWVHLIVQCTDGGHSYGILLDVGRFYAYIFVKCNRVGRFW